MVLGETGEMWKRRVAAFKAKVVLKARLLLTRSAHRSRIA